MKKFPGFTLIELLVVVVVVGVGFALAVPSFQGMVARNRLATNSNELMLAINLARSEASKRAGQIVSLQALNAVNGNEFGGGYCVVLGNPGNCNNPCPALGNPIDCNNPVIRTFSALSGDTTLAGVDDAANGGNWDGVRSSIQFGELGVLSGTSDQLRNFDLCLQGQRGFRIQIALIGRAKSWREAEFGSPIPAVQPNC